MTLIISIDRLKKNEVVKNISILMSGAIIAQILGLIITPILTRMYTPENFGVYQLFLTTSGVISALLALRYDVAVVLPHDKASYFKLLGLIIKLVTFNICFLLILILCWEESFSLFGFEDLIPYKFEVIFSILMLTTQSILNQVNTRLKQFKISSQAKVIYVLVRFVATYIGYYVDSTHGLIWGFIIGHVIVNVTTYLRTSKVEKFSIDFTGSKNIAKEYIDFPTNNMIATFINLFIVQLPVFFLAAHYSDEELGQFSLAFRMTMLPISLVNAAVSTVILKKISEIKKDNRSAKEFTLKTIVILSLSLPVFIVVYFFASDIFQILFGIPWTRAGEISSVLTPYLFMSFICSPISVVFIIYKKNKALVYINLFFGILLISVFTFCKSMGFGLMQTLGYYSVTNCFYYLIVILVIFKILRNNNV